MSTLLAFGAFQFDSATGELTRAGRRVHLAPQTATVLGLLLTHAGALVTRDQIRRTLWAEDTFVEFDAAVNACISDLRAALGDKPVASRFVETVPRKGYRFVAAVTRVTAGVTPATDQDICAAPAARTPAVATGRRSLAVAVVAIGIAALSWMAARSVDAVRVGVLPIEAPAGAAELDALGTLLQERILVDLQQLAGRDFVVLMRPAVEAMRGAHRTVERLEAAGLDFAVDARLMSVQDGKVRLHGKVVRMSDWRILWADDWEFAPAVFMEQRHAIAQEIARRLIRASSGVHDADASASPAAGDAILSAALQIRRGESADLSVAIEKLADVSRYEPRNARVSALRALAAARLLLNSAASDVGTWGHVRADAIAALADRPSDPDALAALGAAALFDARDVRTADRLLARAVAQPAAPVEARGWYSLALSAMASHDRAIAESQRAEQEAPVNVSGVPLARALYLAGRFDDAAAAARRTLMLHPRVRSARFWLWLSQAAVGDAAESETLAALLEERSAGSIVASPLDLRRQYQESVEQAYFDGRGATAFQAAVIAAVRGEIARARAWLDRADRDRSPLLVIAHVHPALSAVDAVQ